MLLKRLSDAEAAGDRVLAVIDGSAVNQDGRTNGLTAPNSRSQQAVIEAALADAGLTAADIGVIEAHGTGTPLGDPIEIEALGAVFGGPASAGRTCAIGSAKANIGHLEGAAGVAALIKAVLTLRHGSVPGLVHFAELNPHISLAGTPFVIPTAARPWPSGGTTRHVGVSSFGWSGTNAHVVVGDAPVPAAAVDRPTADGAACRCRSRCRRTAAPADLGPQRASALPPLVAAYRELLAGGNADLADVCAAASLRRSHHPHRLVAVGRSTTEVVAELDAFLAGDESRGLAVGHVGPGGRPLLVFVFPGQGAQWAGMARGLLAAEPVFRESMGRCAEAFAPHVDWSLVEQLTGPGSRLDDIDVIQPALFAIQVGLAALWRSWGIEPDAVVGHSMGEVAAAHVAGILSLDDAARVICTRSRLLRRIAGRGAMAAVDLSFADAGRAVAGYEDRLAVAVSNGPTSSVIAGDPGALDDVMERLASEEIFCRRVNVDVASHSPQVDALSDELAAALADLDPRPATVPFRSTVTGRFEDGGGLDAGYWVANLRRPVQFGAAVEELLETGHGLFLELSPHPVLLHAIEATIGLGGREGSTIASLRRDADEPVAMRAALGALHVAGQPVDWRIHHPGRARPVDLPRYAWQRERHWVDASGADRRRGRPDHPLLGWVVPVAGTPGLRVWANDIERRDEPTLYEHRIGDVPSLPASAVVERLLAAAAVTGTDVLTDVRFERMLFVDDDEPTATQVVAELDVAGHGPVGLFRQGADGWVRHAVATVGPPATGCGPVPVALDVAALLERRHDLVQIDGAELYRRLDASGVHLGPDLQRVVGSWTDGPDRWAEVTGPPSGTTQPLLLDACLQVAAVGTAAGPDTAGPAALHVPTGADRVRSHGPATARMFVHARAVEGGDGSPVDVTLYADDGAPVASIDGLTLQAPDAVGDRPDDWYYGLEWKPAGAPVPGSPVPRSWLILADAGGVGAALGTRLGATGGACVVLPPGHGGDVGPELVELALAAATVEVVDLRGLDLPGDGPLRPDDLERAVVDGGGGLLALTAAVARSAGPGAAHRRHARGPPGGVGRRTARRGAGPAGRSRSGDRRGAAGPLATAHRSRPGGHAARVGRPPRRRAHCSGRRGRDRRGDRG